MATPGSFFTHYLCITNLLYRAEAYHYVYIHEKSNSLLIQVSLVTN